MADQRESLRWLSGFTKDSAHPQVKRYFPGVHQVDSDGFTALYQRAPNARDSILPLEPVPLLPLQSEIYAARIGRVHSFIDPIDQTTVYNFVNQGFELWANRDTGAYQYTIHPQIDVDFGYLSMISSEEQHGVLSTLDAIYPSITVSNDPISYCPFTLRVNCREYNLNLLTINEEGPTSYSYQRFPSVYEEKENCVALWASHVDLVKIFNGSEIQFFKPTVKARLPKITPEVRGLFDQFADVDNKDFEEKRKIIKKVLTLTRAGVNLELFNPF